MTWKLRGKEADEGLWNGNCKGQEKDNRPAGVISPDRGILVVGPEQLVCFL